MNAEIFVVFPSIQRDYQGG